MNYYGAPPPSNRPYQLCCGKYHSCKGEVSTICLLVWWWPPLHLQWLGLCCGSMEYFIYIHCLCCQEKNFKACFEWWCWSNSVQSSHDVRVLILWVVCCTRGWGRATLNARLQAKLNTALNAWLHAKLNARLQAMYKFPTEMKVYTGIHKLNFGTN